MTWNDASELLFWLGVIILMICSIALAPSKSTDKSQ